MLQEDILGIEYPSPGLLIRKRLQQRGWNQRTLASIINVREPALTQMLTDRQSITPELALAFEDVLGTPAEMLLMLQARLSLAKARGANSASSQRVRRLFAEYPITEMMQRGWLPRADRADPSSVEQALLNYFAVDSLAALNLTELSGLVETESDSRLTRRDLVWLFHTRRLAENIEAPRRCFARSDEILAALKPKMATLEGIASVPRILSGHGIRFLLVQALGASCLDAATLWLSDGAPAIAMTLRVDRVSNFWFVLGHQLAQLNADGANLQNSVAFNLDDGRKDQAGYGPRDSAAHRAAMEFCVPAYPLAAFLARHSRFSEREIQDFARSLGVHPGLVARAIERTTGRYSRRLLNHQCDILQTISRAAVRDGWGADVCHARETRAGLATPGIALSLRH